MNKNKKDHALDLLKGAFMSTSDDNKIYYKNFAHTMMFS